MPKLYDQLASWWPLMSSPAHYVEEAAFYGEQLRSVGDSPARTLLELGSGGGNNASHMKAQFELTLVEPSEGMLAVSRALNPECEHVRGDMRTVRLGRLFDRVFVHDAITYMTTLDDLRSALVTAYEHCRPGGAALFAPDHVREWTWDPDPTDSTYVVDYAYMLREADEPVRVEHDRHVEGLFARAQWLQLVADVGFEPRLVPFGHSELEPGAYELFLGIKRPS
jgi:ubiquinone/menaquinone biosynthesis C-methylase UbiE